MPDRKRLSRGWRTLRVMALAGAVLMAGVTGPAAQQTCEARTEQDPALNNLVHPEGYRTAEPGTLGRVIRMGEGPVDMVLIAGAGFGAEVFDGFMQANAAKYRMLAVTLPGFGGTPAPPMPPDKTSYGELTWTRGAQEAVACLIEEEALDRPVVVGHWLSATTIALGLAVERPDLVRGAIVISGVSRFVPMSGTGMPEPTTVAQRAAMVDQYLAPNWFKTVTRVTWDDGNFMPRDYAIHPLRAQQLWMEAASPTLPVWIRYLCEAWAQDSTADLERLQVPVLILEPEFDDLYHQGPQMGDYMQAFLHRGWTGVQERSDRIEIETIEDSRVFIMDDQPAKLDAAIERFVTGAAARARAEAVKRPASTPAAGPPAGEARNFWGGSVQREGDRFTLSDAGMTLARPDASWGFEPVADTAPLVARMWDADRIAEVKLQVRPTLGMSLEAVVPWLLNGLAQQLPDFESVSTEKTTLDGRDASRLEIRHRKDETMVQTFVLVTLLDDSRMLSLTLQAPAEAIDGFRAAFETIVRSFDLDGQADSSRRDADQATDRPYVAFSRFTDPGPRSAMLDVLPAEPVAIAAVAKNLTVHHNLLAYHGMPREEWDQVQSVWPPRAPDALGALSKTGPGDLLGSRPIKERLRGACMSESHLLATMLRSREIPTRIRAGYFRDVYTNEEHLVAFWEKNAREKGVAKELFEEDPVRWREVNHEYTRQQVAVNKRVEHWAVEYRDEALKAWRLLDANNTFLKAMSDLDVDFHLPRRHFEYAHESWQKMRAGTDFHPDQYAEWPQDGRSHIRSQLLWDFYSLLNHDIAGYDKTAWADEETSTPERDVYAFVKETRLEDVSVQEMAELDALAQLLSSDPDVDALVEFYRGSQHLRIATLGADPYSFVAERRAPTAR